MADNYTANPGTGGAEFAADDVGSGLLVPRVKVQHGPDGSAVDASPANPLPVSAAAESGLMTVAGVPANVKYAPISAASSGNNTIVAAVTSKKIRVLSMFLMAAGAVNAKFQSGAGGTDLSGLLSLDSLGAGMVLGFNPAGWFESASGVLLNLNLSAAVAVGGGISYIEV